VDTANKKFAAKKVSEENWIHKLYHLPLRSKSNKFGWPGQDLKGVQGLYFQTGFGIVGEANAPNKEACERAGKVGGGLIGIRIGGEMTEKSGYPVTFF